jgi:hypothetical protein
MRSRAWSFACALKASGVQMTFSSKFWRSESWFDFFGAPNIHFENNFENPAPEFFVSSADCKAPLHRKFHLVALVFIRPLAARSVAT